LHSKDVDNYTLKCSFCRNDIPAGSNKNSKPLTGEFITVLCDGCVQVIKDNPQAKLGPKKAICLCNDTPREMEIWEAFEETKAKTKEINDLNLENDKRMLKALKVDYNDEDKESISFKPTRSKKVSDL